ncbi:MAG: hypothetical protein ACHREM_04585 [Polyangiales bacterium]
MHTIRSFSCSIATVAAMSALAGCGGTVDANGLSPDGAADETASGDASGSDSTTSDAIAADAADAAPPTPGLHIGPIDPILVYDLSTSTAPSQAFKATLVDATGGATDVTGSSTFTLDDATFGKFVGASFLADAPATKTIGAATTQVHAMASGLESSTYLTIVRMNATPTATGPGQTLITAPAGGTPVPGKTVLAFTAGGASVDVAIVLDSTGSMTGEIGAITTGLSGDLITRLQAIAPDVGVGLVDFKDTAGSCGPDAYVLRVDSPIVTGATTITTAAMTAIGGCDTPEANIAAMMFTLTGEANTALSPAIPAHTSPPGHYGGVDFRQGVTPVVVMISDASWHDPSGSATLAKVEAAFKSTGAVFVDVLIDLASGDSSGPQSITLSDATGSTAPASRLGGSCPTTTAPTGQCRLIFPAQSDGSGVINAIVAAIGAIDFSGGTTSARVKLSSDPSNPGGVDATSLIQSVRAMDEGSAGDGCAPQAATDTDGDGIKDTFTSLTASTKICFEVTYKPNTSVPATTYAQLFTAYATLTAEPGDVPTSQRDTLLFVVPVAK